MTDVLMVVLQWLSPVLATVLTAILVALAKKAFDRLGVSHSEKLDAMIDKYVKIGVSYAERAAKKKLFGRELSSEDKLALATKTVLTELEQSGVKKVAEDLIVARIEAFLEGEKEPKKEV